MYSRLIKIFFFSVVMMISTGASAVCESGSAVERLSCMRAEFCPEASTVDERTACYQMITEVFRQERQASSRSQKKVSESPSISKPVSEDIVQEGESVSLELAVPPNSDDSDSELLEGKKSKKRRFQLMGWAQSDKEEDFGPEWTKVVFVRSESSGAELVVLEGGEVWGEINRNGFVSLAKGDWVKIAGTSKLVRRGGGAFEVSRIDCALSKGLKGRCRGLKKFL